MFRFEVIHVYELLTHLLNLTPATNDGSLQIFEGMLRDYCVLVSCVIIRSSFAIIWIASNQIQAHILPSIKE